jgi:hypothetical protein
MPCRFEFKPSANRTRKYILSMPRFEPESIGQTIDALSSIFAYLTNGLACCYLNSIKDPRNSWAFKISSSDTNLLCIQSENRKLRWSQGIWKKIIKNLCNFLSIWKLFIDLGNFL